MRLVLGIEYDGSGFCGWQTQPAGCAVQDRLEAACASIAGVPVSTICAGRTDAGVHALGQIVHFDCTVERPASAWVRGVNALLPPSVAVTWAQPVGDDFHARFSALKRSYRYVLLNDAVRPAADQGRVGWFHSPLDLEAMKMAAVNLLGEHDFTAFRATCCQTSTHSRARCWDCSGQGSSRSRSSAPAPWSGSAQPTQSAWAGHHSSHWAARSGGS